MSIKLERREDGRFRLTESFSINSNELRKLPLTEKTIISEGGKEYKCISAFTVPISRYDKENFNGRIYTKKLWENVIKNQKDIYEGCYGLCDHPEGDKDGSVKDSFCVWHNPRLDEDNKLVLADMYLFGFWGKHAKEGIDAGGRMEFSSSGFGDFNEDGVTIQEDTYEIERLSDWVLMGSQNVNVGMGDEIKSSSNKSETLKKSSTNNIEETKFDTNKEIKMSNIQEKLNKVEEKNFIFNIKNSIKEAEKSTSLKEKLDSYREIHSFCNEVDFAQDIKKQVQESIVNLEKEVFALENTNKEVIEESSKVKEENKKVKTDNTVLQRKYEKACDMLNDLKVYTNKVKELLEVAVAEKNGMVDPDEYRELAVYCESIEKENDELKSEVKKLKKENKKSVKDKIYKRTRRYEQDDEEIEEEDDEEEKTEKKKEKCKTKKEQDDEEMEEEDDEEEKKSERKKRKEKKSKKEQDDDEIEEEDDEEEKKSERKKRKEKKSKKEQDDDEIEEEDDEEEKTEKKKEKKAKKEDDDEDEEKLNEEDDEEMEEEDDEEEKTEKKGKKSEYNFRNDDRVYQYYLDLIDENSKVRKIKDEILKCKTVKEAQITYLNLKDLVENNFPNPYRRLIKEKFDSDRDNNSVEKRPNILKNKPDNWL